MKVLFNASNFPKFKGDSTTPFILILAKELHKKGIEVAVLAPHAEGAKLHEFIDGVEIFRFKYFPLVRFETIFEGGGAIASLRKRPLRYFLVPGYFISQIYNLRRLAKQWKPDIIHSHWLIPQALSARFAGRSMPKITTVHGGDVFAFQGTFRNYLKKISVFSSDVIVANSKTTLQSVKSISPDAEAQIIPMGIEYAKFSQPGRAQRIKDGLRIIFVGRILEEKGIFNLLKAVEIIGNKINLLKLTVVGDGKDLAKAKKIVQQDNLKDRVFFTGWVDNDKLPDYYHDADIFVSVPQKSKEGWQEALGLTYFEAMASGLPVIGAKNTGFSGVVKDGENAILVSQNKPLELANAIIALSRNQPKLEKIASHGKILAKSFDYSLICDKYISVYKKLTHGK